MEAMQSPAQFLARSALQTLIDVLSSRGYRVIGPQVRDGAIVYADLAQAGDGLGAGHEQDHPEVDGLALGEPPDDAGPEDAKLFAQAKNKMMMDILKLAGQYAKQQGKKSIGVEDTARYIIENRK